MNKCGDMEVCLHAFITSEMDSGGRPVWRRGRCVFWKTAPGAQWQAGVVGPSVRQVVVEERKFCASRMNADSSTTLLRSYILYVLLFRSVEGKTDGCIKIWEVKEVFYYFRNTSDIIQSFVCFKTTYLGVWKRLVWLFKLCSVHRQAKWLDDHGWWGYGQTKFDGNPFVLSKLTRQEYPWRCL